MKVSQVVVPVALLVVVILLAAIIVGTNNSSNSGTPSDTAGVMPLEVVPAISDTSGIVEASSANTNNTENGSPSLPLLRATEAVRVIHR